VLSDIDDGSDEDGERMKLLLCDVLIFTPHQQQQQQQWRQCKQAGVEPTPIGAASI